MSDDFEFPRERKRAAHKSYWYFLEFWAFVIVLILTIVIIWYIFNFGYVVQPKGRTYIRT